MRRDEQILTWIQDGLERFAADLRNHTVYLFGSRARGDSSLPAYLAAFDLLAVKLVKITKQ